MTIETPESYFRRVGVIFSSQTGGSNGQELKFPCPDPGCSSDPKKKKASINAKTWKWQCFVCGAKGNEHSLKSLRGDIYHLKTRDGSKTIEEHKEEEFIKALNTRAKDQKGVENWHKALLEHPGAQRARDYLLERGLKQETWIRAYLGWCSGPDGSIARHDPDTVPSTPVQSDPAPEESPAAQEPPKRGRGRGRGRGRRRRNTTATPQRSGRRSEGGFIVIPSFVEFDTIIQEVLQEDLEEEAIQVLTFKPRLDSCALVKLRAVDPSFKPKYLRLTGGKTVLYTPGGINPNQTMIITGGELDALSVLQEGHDNVVSGSGGEGTWKDIWTRQLDDCNDLVVVYDNDDVGQESAQKTIDQLGKHRCRKGRWPEPYKDGNASLVHGDLDIFTIQIILKEADVPMIEGVQHVDGLRSAYFARLKDKDVMKGLSTGWKDLDALMGGLRRGEITLVTGDTGCGKSTWASQLALNLTEKDHGVLFCPFEMKPIRQTNKWIRQLIEDEPCQENIREVKLAFDQLSKLPLWMFYKQGELKTEALRQTLLYGTKRLGMKVAIIDHLHFIVSSGQSEREELDAKMTMLTEVVEETGLHVVVLAHPSKIGGVARHGKHRDNVVVQAADLKGSSGLKQMADNILSFWRPRKEDRSDVIDPDTGYGTAACYVLKSREEYGQEGAVTFSFWIKAAKFLTDVNSMFKGKAHSRIASSRQKPGGARHIRHWSDDDDSEDDHAPP